MAPIWTPLLLATAFIVVGVVSWRALQMEGQISAASRSAAAAPAAHVGEPPPKDAVVPQHVAPARVPDATHGALKRSVGGDRVVKMAAAAAATTGVGTPAAATCAADPPSAEPSYNLDRPTKKQHWRGRFSALALYENVCLSATPDEVLLVARAGSAVDPEPGGNAVNRLLAKQVWLDRGKLERATAAGRVAYFNGTSVLHRAPHARNIAHAFADALFLGLHYLRAVAEGAAARGFAGLRHEPCPARRSIVAASLAGMVGRPLWAVVRNGGWSEGVLAAAALSAGLPDGQHGHFVASPTTTGGAGAKTYACFERLVFVGSSRDACVDAGCNKMHSADRDATFNWVNNLTFQVVGRAEAAGSERGAAGRRVLRVGLYLREDMELKRRRIVGADEFNGCLVEAVANGTVGDAATGGAGGGVSDYNESWALPRRWAANSTAKLDAPALSKFVAAVAKIPWPARNVDVEVVRLASAPNTFYGQAAVWSTLDVLVAPAGAANTNALWMRPGGARRTAVIVLAQCNLGYISWMGTTRLPRQDVVTFKLCSKQLRRHAGVAFEKPAGGGLRIPCAALQRITGGHMRVTFPDALFMMLGKAVETV
jgi:hypothetical protein